MWGNSPHCSRIAWGIVTWPLLVMPTRVGRLSKIRLRCRDTDFDMAKGGWQEFSRPESLERGTASGPPGRPTPKTQQRVRVQRSKAGKGGKLVTAITGLEAPETELKALLKQLKAAAGTGGTLKDGVIELQGDQVAPALAALEQAGFRPKQAGGLGGLAPGDRTAGGSGDQLIISRRKNPGAAPFPSGRLGEPPQQRRTVAAAASRPAPGRTHREGSPG